MASKLRLVFALVCWAFSIPTLAYVASADEEELADDLVHSDVPLFGDETSDKWPQHISGGNEIGCISRVSFGNWILRHAGNGMEDHPTWYRIQNYGVFHCWALVGVSREGRQYLDKVDMEPSFFVLMGVVGSMELWALQMGGRPGSDYLLLSRQPGQGIISNFSVLQRECPEQNARKGPSLDIIRTDYCTIKSAAELRQLAELMLEKKPLGTLNFVENLKDEGK